MHDFQDAPLVGPGSELQLTLEGGARRHEEVDAETLLGAVVEPEAVGSFSVVELGEEAEALEFDLTLARVGARGENLYVAGERLAARAASPATRSTP